MTRTEAANCTGNDTTAYTAQITKAIKEADRAVEEWIIKEPKIASKILCAIVELTSAFGKAHQFGLAAIAKADK